MPNNQLTKQSVVVLLLGWTFAWIGVGQVIGAEDRELGPAKAGIFDDTPEVQESPVAPGVKVGSFGQVDLHVKDLEISQVLQLLSLQSQRNIIASRNVAGTVSADLYGVDFYEALDAVLHPNGFGYQEKGNLIFVYTAAELQALEEAQRKLTHRLVRLNYITAADASAFVTPLLSPAGQISVSADVATGFQPSVADGGANSFAHSDTLVIYDYEENVEEILAVLHELDKRPKQVLVEATILQARLTENNAFGVDLSILADFALSTFLDPLGVVDEVLTGTTPLDPRTGAVSTTVGNTNTGDSGVKVAIVTHSVGAFIKALDSVTDTAVIANPKLLVLNRQRADLLVGEKLGYLSSTATDTSTTQTVEFLEIGTQLTLRPFVSGDGFIRMELRPSVSDGNTNRTVGTFVVPETTNQEMTTNVVVRNGQTVVMGGLFKEDTEITRRQVPGFGDVPILGAMFKGQDDTVGRNEVIFLITPTIVRDDTLYEIGERTAEGIETVRLGARQGLLPWSRTKLTAAHIREAQRFYDGGDHNKALWSVNMALTLDPKSMQAVRLKEKLTGQPKDSPMDLSIVNEAVTQFIRGGDGGSSRGDGQAPVNPDRANTGESDPFADQTDAATTQPSGPGPSTQPSAAVTEDRPPFDTDSDAHSDFDTSGGVEDVTTDQSGPAGTVPTQDGRSPDSSGRPDIEGQAQPTASTGGPWLKNFFDLKKAAGGPVDVATPANAQADTTDQTIPSTDGPGFDDDAQFTGLIDPDTEFEGPWFDEVEPDAGPSPDRALQGVIGTGQRTTGLDGQDGVPGVTDPDDWESGEAAQANDADPSDPNRDGDTAVIPTFDGQQDQQDAGLDWDATSLDDDDAALIPAVDEDRDWHDNGDLDWPDTDSDDEAALSDTTDDLTTWQEGDGVIDSVAQSDGQAARPARGSSHFESGQLDRRVMRRDEGSTADPGQGNPTGYAPTTDPFHAVVEWLPVWPRHRRDNDQDR